jgi:hypothetical protein
MKLVLVPLASAVKFAPHLWPGGQVVGTCIHPKVVANAPGMRWTCGATVKAGEGYADVEGTPWEAYYCRECADRCYAHLKGTP